DAAAYDIQYSDDGSTWTTVAWNFQLTVPGWNTISWADAGSHRYWRLLLTNTPGVAPWKTELELNEVGGFAGITASNSYNKRLQPVVLSASAPSQTVFSLSYDFNWGTPTALINNGTLKQIANNRDTNRSQSFTYDQLNRVVTAQSQATSGTHCWGNSFAYDIWANLLSKTVTKCTSETLSVAVNTNNRITNPGFTYDAAGNLTNSGSGVITYDAENRIATVAGVTYTYASLGRFLTPDWSATPVPVPYANLAIPQSLNLYAYVENNPITSTDPDGHFQTKLPEAEGKGNLCEGSSDPSCKGPEEAKRQEAQRAAEAAKRATPETKSEALPAAAGIVGTVATSSAAAAGGASATAGTSASAVASVAGPAVVASIVVAIVAETQVQKSHNEQRLQGIESQVAVQNLILLASNTGQKIDKVVSNIRQAKDHLRPS
ncbi:MAG: hypothetical protein L0099_15265, partial [Acidobacteria bacterium]|nr:hypothetical protein [Acidobacteriota bacterium]